MDLSQFIVQDIGVITIALGSKQKMGSNLYSCIISMMPRTIKDLGHPSSSTCYTSLFSAFSVFSAAKYRFLVYRF